MSETRHPSHLRLTALLIVVFVVTRIAGYLAGLRYLSEELPRNWQLLDLNLLHYHLTRALLHLHAQPPLYNALVGLAEKVGGSHFAGLLWVLQLLLGLAAMLAVFQALLELQIAPALACATALFLILNPASLLYEVDPLYTELVYALHCFIALAVVRFLRSRSAGMLGLTILLCVALILLRSSYQPVWLVALMVVLLWAVPARRRQIAALGALGLGLALLWPAKNYVLFHHFASSTWAPFSMAKHWRYPADQRRIQPFVQQDRVPTFAPRPQESGVTELQFPGWLQQHFPAPRTGYPELDDLSKQDGGWPNWNSLAMLHMRDAQARDISFLLHHAPKSYLLNVGRGTLIYFEPSTTYFKGWGGPSVMQWTHVAGADRVARHLCCNPLGLPAYAYQTRPPDKFRLSDLCLGSLLLYLVLLACAISLVTTLWRESRVRQAAVVCLLVTIAYIFVLANLLEVGENMRFRFEVHALACMVAAIFFQQLWDWRRKAQPPKAA